MSLGETVGTRGLVEQAQTRSYCKSTTQSGFAAESFGTLVASELDALVKAADTVSAAKQTSRYRLEFIDAYCLRRDIRYGLRSRKWLFAKGQQTNLNNGYAAWNIFAMENLDHSTYLKTLPPKSARDLENIPFATILNGG